MSLEELSSVKCFGGFVKQYKHNSKSLSCSLTFVVFVPETNKPLPVLYYLSGLTCTDQNFITKAGGFQYAAKKGIMLVCPDTSPRNITIEGQDDSYDFGSGAGFYLDATEPKWKENYNMYSYITQELPTLVNENFDTNREKTGIFGHSMGGHGALICALKNPTMYKSVSALSPICNPTKCPWGEKAFKGYLGSVEAGKEYDACELIANSTEAITFPILIDQGTGDNFLTENQLLPENLVKVAAKKKVQVALRMQEGYDHGFYFIRTFLEDHINHHATFLCN